MAKIVGDRLRSNFVLRSKKRVSPDAQSRPVLPARLDDARNLSLECQLAEAQAADAELAQVAARPSAELAAVVLPARKLRLARVFNSFCSGCHIYCSVLLLAYAAWRNGMPNCRSSARAELSSLAVVTIVMFMPFSLSTFA